MQYIFYMDTKIYLNFLLTMILTSSLSLKPGR